MEHINSDIIINIWSYVGIKSLCLTNLQVRQAIYRIMHSFKEIPVILNYRLIKWKKIITTRPVRATMKVENTKQCFLTGGDPINISENNIIVFGSIKKKIIPKMRTEPSLIPGRNYKITWSILKCFTKNIERARLYSIFWNNY